MRSMRRWIPAPCERGTNPMKRRSAVKYSNPLSRIPHPVPCRLPAGNRHLRSGFSLIEVVTVISILTVMLTLTGITFHLLLKTDKVVAQSFITERGISRLSVQFRDDVHQAENGIVKNDPNTGTSDLVLENANGTRIHYSATPSGLSRLLVERDQVVSREDFRLPECQVSMSTGEGPQQSLRILRIERPGAVIVNKSNSIPVPRRSLRIEANLNRFSTTQTPSAPAGIESPSTADTTETQQ